VTDLLAGQRALVTGGGHGILDVDAEAAHAAAVTVDGLTVVADIADPTATTAAVDEAAAALGGLTTVFANAGFGVSRPLESFDDDEFDRVVTSPARSTRCAPPSPICERPTPAPSSRWPAPPPCARRAARGRTGRPRRA
jgi:NAD(P)-dependent dehydrogenase (short-subunit alcohol dehydrogenase family)